MAHIVSWTGSNEREDGSTYAATERHGYNVSIVSAGQPAGAVIYTAISQEYDFSIDLAQMGAPLTDGDYSLYVQDEDTDGRVSQWSAPANFTWVVANPKPPTNLGISVS